jgi:AraC-like DNA-binding protein
MPCMFFGVIILLLVVFGIRRSMATDRSVESFAETHGIVLDEVTRPFLTHHLARLQMHRLWGSLIGAIVGIVVGSVLGSTLLVVFVLSLVGSLVGMSAAEAARYFRRTTGAAPRIAALERRDRSQYLSESTRRVERIVCVLLALSAFASLAFRSKAPLLARVVVTALAVGVLFGGWLVGRRIAHRSADVTNTRLQPADRAIRSAAIDVVGAIVASLVLCAVVWLLQTPSQTGTLTVRRDDGVLLVSIPDAQTPWSVTVLPAPGNVTWTDGRGATHSTVVEARDTSPEQGITAGLSTGWLDFFRPLLTLLLAAWAFGEWLHVSRVPFRRPSTRRARGSRPSLVAS